VLYYDGPFSRLKRTLLPRALAEKESTWMPEGQKYAPCALTCSIDMTLPPGDSWALQTLQLSVQERYRYQKMLSAFREEKQKPLHRLLGYPDALQGDMQMNCELLSRSFSLGDGLPGDGMQLEQLQREAQKWRLLLQLDTDEDAQMLWGINGRCYYWIQEEALKQRQFAETWCILQWT
jgi:uncharacterized protein YwqG